MPVLTAEQTQALVDATIKAREYLTDRIGADSLDLVRLYRHHRDEFLIRVQRIYDAFLAKHPTLVQAKGTEAWEALMRVTNDMGNSLGKDLALASVENLQGMLASQRRAVAPALRSIFGDSTAFVQEPVSVKDVLAEVTTTVQGGSTFTDKVMAMSEDVKQNAWRGIRSGLLNGDDFDTVRQRLSRQFGVDQLAEPKYNAYGSVKTYENVARDLWNRTMSDIADDLGELSVWYAVLDERTTPGCLARHGRTLDDLGEQPPRHINCRCTVAVLDAETDLRELQAEAAPFLEELGYSRRRAFSMESARESEQDAFDDLLEAEFDEGQHPRDDKGRFSGSGSDVPSEQREAYYKAIEDAPVNDAIEDAESAWRGGVGDFGDPEAALLIQGMDGYFDYRSHLEEHARATLGDSFSLYRLMRKEQLEDWQAGSDIDPIAATFDRGFAEKFVNFAGFKGDPADMILVRIPATPESIVMRGAEEESEIVINPNAISADTIEVLGTPRRTREAEAFEALVDRLIETWREELHPRDDAGKFTDGGGDAGAPKTKVKKAAKPEAVVPKTEATPERDAAIAKIRDSLGPTGHVDEDHVRRSGKLVLDEIESRVSERLKGAYTQEEHDRFVKDFETEMAALKAKTLPITPEIEAEIKKYEAAMETAKDEADAAESKLRTLLMDHPIMANRGAAIQDEINTLRAAQFMAYDRHRIARGEISELQKPKQSEETKLQIAALWSKRQEMANRFNEAQKAERDTYVAMYKEVVEAVLDAPLGPGEQLSIKKPGRRTPTFTEREDAIKRAASLYPRSWWDQSESDEYVIEIDTSKARGHYMNLSKTAFVRLGDGSLYSTAVHELGHHFEQVFPWMTTFEKNFWDRRTKGERPKKLQTLAPRHGYSKHEMAVADEFGDPYVGKVQYSSGHMEILTMGMQALVDPRFGKIRADKDHMAFVLGLIVGKIKPATGTVA